MRLSWLLTLPAVLSVAIQKRDADFFSVRTKMNKDMSGREGDPKGKYFHESVFHPHYDGRFADRQLGYRERKAALSNLIQTYLATFADIGVETWLMHGTLLGWWWNRKILPWDSDSDVQVSESSMHYLASYYNMTVFHYKTPRIPEGRDYMLEINPHYINREQTDSLNVIDARWVDTESGLFIDITTARYNTTHAEGEGMLSCKDGHEYRDSYIFPLRDTYFEGAPAKIPFAYKELLQAEYNEKALTVTEFEGHHFDEDKFEWVPVRQKVDLPPVHENKKPGESKPTNQELMMKKADENANSNHPVNVPSTPKTSISPIANHPVPQQQNAAEEKLIQKEENKDAAVKKMEDKRKVEEQKAIEKEDKMKEDLKRAEEKKAKLGKEQEQLAREEMMKARSDNATSSGL